MNKIPEWTERKLWSSIINPVIIKVKSNKFNEVYEYIKANILDNKVISKIINKVVTPERIKIISRKIMSIKFFDYIAFPAIREFVWALETENFVEKIYYDNDVKPLQLPSVPSNGIYNFIIVNKFKVKGTTTFYTRDIIGATKANNEGYLGYDVKVSVCDTGSFHLPGIEKVKLRKVVGVTDVDLANGHGVWVCSCICSRYVIDERMSKKIGKTLQIEGIAPGVECYSVKCLEFYGGKTSWVIKALEDSIFKYNVDVINMSLGGPLEVEKPEDDPMYNPLKVCCDLNKIACVASGNSGKGNLCSPGSLPVCLRVGAYDPVTGKIAKFTSRGVTPWGEIVPDIVMPGVWIYAHSTGELDTIDSEISGFSPLSGTSMATPHATGIVSLMKEAHRKLLGKELTLDEIILMMSELGEYKEKSEDYGFGVLTWDKYEKWLSTQYGVEP